MDKTMNRIKEVLEEKGIKQTWLAEKLGKSFCIINSYVCNRRQPSLDVLFEIAKILQVDPIAYNESSDTNPTASKVLKFLVNHKNLRLYRSKII